MLRIAVTGSSGFVGQVVIKQLTADPEVEAIFAIDIAPSSDHPKVTWIKADVRDPALGGILKQAAINALAHLAFIIEARGNPERMYDVNVNGTANVLKAAAEAHVDRFLMMSSLAIYGAWPDNPDLLTEECLPRPNPEDAYGQHKLKAEWMCHAFAEEHPEVAMAIIRPCGIMGPHISANYILSMVKAPFLPLPRRARGSAQFIHVDDVARLTVLLLKQRARGIYNAAEPSTLPWRSIYERLGRPVIALPRWFLNRMLAFLWRLKLLPVIPVQMEMVSYPAVLSGDRARTVFGFQARYNIQTTLDQTLESLHQLIPVKRRRK
ncbi:MAG: NAD-dependent epimerase/dehydratase family protein [Anaerolineae bacterium]